MVMCCVGGVIQIRHRSKQSYINPLAMVDDTNGDDDDHGGSPRW